LNITLGQIVYSKAGRDSGKKFIVVGIINDVYVLISDGDVRKIDKPKKKKLKHLKITELVINDLKEKMLNNIIINNSDIKKCLALN